MEKQKAIELAYGEYWDIAKPSENGWCKFDDINIDIFRKLDMESYNSFCSNTIRPKSLQGIESNNGWISVNNKMPTEIGMYFIVNNEGEVTIELAIKRTERNNHKVFYHIEFMTNDIVTHWQPIIKPPNPIY